MSLINKKQEYQDQEEWSDNVQKLKGYKEFKEKVEFWGNKNYIIQGSYEIVYDNELGWCVDVDGDVSFIGLDITEIPFQFRNVSGSFSCSYCRNLASLKYCPVYVGNVFSCNFCGNLTSLEYCPKEVDDFNCYDCGKKFTRKYVRSLCNVKRRIVV